MKAIIPAKKCSTRVKDKNFREFYKGDSLTDILIKKLLKVLDGSDIYLSSDDESLIELCDKYGINFLKRNTELTSNSTPMSKVITEVVKDVPGTDDIMWCLVTDPLFDAYDECVKIWEGLDKKNYDSLCIVYEYKGYMLDESFKPMGFGFGVDHIPTQNLKSKYMLNNTMFMIQRKAVFDNQYYIGKKPYWFVAKNYSVDIDTEMEFEMAKVLYEFKTK